MPTGEDDLQGRLKRERLHKPAQQPFPRSLFVRVNFLVQTYGLGEAFLDKLDEFTENFSLEQLNPTASPVKGRLQLPLFALAPPERYRLTMAIIEKVKNPYLHFAQSPEEILWCNPLYKRNPDLAPELLASNHFQTLLLSDLAGEKPGRSKEP
jgi:hypothetical protein